MRVLLDTNILLVITPYFSAYRWVYDALKEGRFELVVSTEILAEYAEVLERQYSAIFAERTLLALDNFPTVIRVEPAFRFLLIPNDPDDNKFIDAAVIGNADYIVTNDGHFEHVSTIPFPKIDILAFDAFCSLLKQFLSE
ncbi:putative toxin-antitoxin system toxin component, PIN family [Spirosoma panaciterrae]|uniref:putative toxin-antitoxin system toxin component, PIN family n=1 Tax=Spirosoma panaciterrae TaxID=496058 RepID=UPI00035EAF1C|nr:putative toxin-antitoxin system toxin component, PIN family [Spirosoma panaciterrae]